ncbi:MAG: lysylphosphatidylglycerol synthase transmembrane domain-containing protein, partial [Chloroflexota bacterium]|nr:lysylphosphatidylglycerol synthase transmembrane domain-containing protein [Chloroflexota bacterium]
PARAGELLRSVMIGRKTGINVGFALATTLTERIIDAGILVLLALISIAALETAPDVLIAGARAGAILASVGIAGVLIAPRLERQLRALLAWLLAKLPLPAGIAEKLDAFLVRFLTGMRALINPRRAVLFALFAAGAWSIDVVVASMVGRAFDMALTVPQILLLLASLGLASAAPSTPGYIGIYQAVAVAVLVPFGYTESTVIVFIIAFQIVSYLMVIAFGALGLWRLNTGGARIGDLLKTET